MVEYVIRRIILIIPVLLGITFLIFVSIRLIPGDPAVLMAGEGASEKFIQTVREQLHLDKPLLVQYGIFMKNLLKGDMGRSAISKLPVANEIFARFPATLELAIATMVISVLIGLPAGILSALKPNSALDNIVMVMALIGVSFPKFWLGLMLMLIFSVSLGWLPTIGRGTILHLILPALTMSTSTIAVGARMTRSCMLEVLGHDYIRTAHSKGLSERVVIVKHALKNALIPVLTVFSLQFGFLMGGAVITETVFAWPGIGRLMVDAVLNRDYPMIQGTVLVIGTSFVLINLAVDLLYSIFDPRIRYN